MFARIIIDPLQLLQTFLSLTFGKNSISCLSGFSVIIEYIWLQICIQLKLSTFAILQFDK
jgi:hypothetical protein